MVERDGKIFLFKNNIKNAWILVIILDSIERYFDPRILIVEMLCFRSEASRRCCRIKINNLGIVSRIYQSRITFVRIEVSP